MVGFMAIEKKWPAVPPQLFTADGTALGVVNVASASGFRVKQAASIQSNSLPAIRVQVKRVVSSTQIVVGPIPNEMPINRQQGRSGLTERSDLSAYTVADGAFIYAEEQQKVPIDPREIMQAVYRQEPGTTIGVELDDEFGNAFDIENPLPIASSPIWDETDLTYDANQNLETVTYKKAGLTVVLTLSYDSNQNLIKVTKS